MFEFDLSLHYQMRKTLKIKQPSFKYKTVMLIDDNEMDNFINQKIIEANFFSDKIYTNTNGLSALEFLNNLLVNKETLNQMLPEIIFVDLNMPLINGFQFIESFYKLPKELAQACKIVILTSSLSAEDRDIAKTFKQKITFLNKPLTQESLSSIS